jgi:hypothetical protein
VPGTGLTAIPVTFCNAYVHRWRIGRSFAAFSTESWLSYLACLVLTTMSPEQPFGPQDAETLSKQLHEASECMWMALRDRERAHHHLTIVQERLDDLEQRIATLRSDMSYRLRK